jgi:hypothetical protein
MSDIKYVEINKKVVEPIKNTKLRPDRIKGYDMFPDLYCNIFLCAKKKSGKTSVIYKILKECCDADTVVYCFCSTHNKDDNYKAIKTLLEEKKMTSYFFTSLIEDKVNMLEVILTDLQNQPDTDEENEPEVDPPQSVLKFYESNEGLGFKMKKNKKKKMAPKIIFIFDDFSGELRDGNITKLLKEHRHHKSKVIISSQHPNDLSPAGRAQIDYWLLFQGHSEVKLEEMFSYMNVDITEEQFKSLYHQATKEKYHFFYIDRNNEEFRKDFNYRIII